MRDLINLIVYLLFGTLALAALLFLFLWLAPLLQPLTDRLFNGWLFIVSGGRWEA